MSGRRSLKAIDIDIEHTEFENATVRKRVVAALAKVRAANPSLAISITLGTAETGPEAAGRSLIADAAAIGFQPTVWTVMPFDFGVPLTDMGHASIKAVEGLAGDLERAYAISAATAYAHAGLSSMNGHTDEASGASETSARCSPSCASSTSRASPSGPSAATANAPPA